MTKLTSAAPAAAALLASLLIAPAVSADMNKSIHIGDGESVGARQTVNGSISVGANAMVDGSLETVNGTIRVDEGSSLEDATTVNGGIHLANGVSAEDVSSVNGTIDIGQTVVIDGEVSVVNGKIVIEHGSRIAEDVSNVNGAISISGAEVGGDLSTVNGDVTLRDGATVRGDLVVEKPGGVNWFGRRPKPRIEIGPGSTVAGTIRLEREVELFISDTATVGGVSGVMSLDDATRFSGDRP